MFTASKASSSSRRIIISDSEALGRPRHKPLPAWSGCRYTGDATLLAAHRATPAWIRSLLLNHGATNRTFYFDGHGSILLAKRVSQFPMVTVQSAVVLHKADTRVRNFLLDARDTKVFFLCIRSVSVSNRQRRLTLLGPKHRAHACVIAVRERPEVEDNGPQIKSNSPKRADDRYPFITSLNSNASQRDAQPRTLLDVYLCIVTLVTCLLNNPD